MATEKIVCLIMSFKTEALILYLVFTSLNSFSGITGNSSAGWPAICKRDLPLLHTALNLSSVSITIISSVMRRTISVNSFASSAMLPASSTCAGTTAVSMHISLSFPISVIPTPSIAVSNTHSKIGLVVRVETARPANANASCNCCLSHVKNTKSHPYIILI
jgi:hypothetical protein